MHGAVSFYLHNRVKIDEYLVEQERLEDSARERIEKIFPPDEIARKITARKKGERVD